MRKLLFILFLIPCIAQAQYDSTRNLQPVNGYGFQWNNGRFKTPLRFAGDTIKMAVGDSGSITTKGGNVYVWTGYKWKVPNADAAPTVCSGLIGGGVSHANNLTFNIASAKYCIRGIGYIAYSDSVTLATAHPTLDRIDVIAADTLGNFVVITGTPATNPQTPQVDPFSQYYLTSVLVKGGSITPSNVSSVTIWNENVEWTGSVTGATANFDNTSNVFNGAKSTNVTPSTISEVTYTGSGYLKSNFNNLSFFIKLKAATSDIQYAVSLGGSQKLELSPMYGFNNSITDFQNIVIPVSDFIGVNDTIRTFALSTTSLDGYYLDWVTLQGGVSTGTSPYVENVILRNDSLFQKKNGVELFVGSASGGGLDTTKIPLTGTEVGKPITGDLLSQKGIYLENANGSAVDLLSENGSTISLNRISGATQGELIMLPNYTSVYNRDSSGLNSALILNEGKVKVGGNLGLFGELDYSASYDSLSYTQRDYVIPRGGTLPNKPIFGDLKINGINKIDYQTFGTSARLEIGDTSINGEIQPNLKFTSAGSTGKTILTVTGTGRLSGNVKMNIPDVGYSDTAQATLAVRVNDRFADESGTVFLDNIRGSDKEVSTTYFKGIKVTDNTDFAGLQGEFDFSANYDDLTYVQKIYVDTKIADSMAAAKSAIPTSGFGLEKTATNKIKLNIEPQQSYSEVSASTQSYDWNLISDGELLTWYDGVSVANYNDTIMLLGGWNTVGGSINTVKQSVDGGVTWSERSTLPYAVHTPAFIASGDGYFYLIGGDYLNDNTERASVYRTNDFINWELRTDNSPFGNRILHSGVEYKGSLYVGGGQHGLSISDTLYKDIWKSDDGGATWDKIADSLNFMGKNVNGTMAVFAGQMWQVSGGKYDSNPANNTYDTDVYSSQDGVNWYKREPIPTLGVQYPNVTVWDGKLWLMQGSAQTVGNIDSLTYMDAGGKWYSWKIPVRPTSTHASSFVPYKNQLLRIQGNVQNQTWALTKSTKYIYNNETANYRTKTTFDKIGNNADGYNLDLVSTNGLNENRIINTTATNVTKWVGADYEMHNGNAGAKFEFLSDGTMKSAKAQLSNALKVGPGAFYTGSYFGTDLQYQANYPSLLLSGISNKLALGLDGSKAVLRQEGSTSGNRIKFDIANGGMVVANNSADGVDAFQNERSIADFQSTTKGFLVPRMTTAQRNAITVTVTEKGMQVFDTDLNKIYWYTGAAWETWGGGGAAIPTNEIAFGNGTSITSSQYFKFDDAAHTLNFALHPTDDFKSALMFGGYSSVGAIKGGAAFIFGTGVAPSMNANKMVKTTADLGHYIHAKYNKGIGFYIGVSGAAATEFNDENTGALAATISLDKNFGINQAAPTQKLDVSGNIKLTGSIVTYDNSVGSLNDVLTSNGTGASNTYKTLKTVGGTSLFGAGDIPLPSGTSLSYSIIPNSNTTLSVGNNYKISTTLLTANRTYTMPAGTIDGQIIEIYNNNTTGFTATLGGSPVYYWDEVTILTTLSNSYYQFVWQQGKWTIKN